MLVPLGALPFLDPPFARRELPPRIDAALVLSGDVDYLRLKQAAELYREGQVRLIVLTGTGVGGDSAVAMRDFAQSRLGVPVTAMILETRSVSTRQNIEFVAPLLRQSSLRQVALVTSASHMGRALRTARWLVPEVEWLPVPVDDARPPARARRTRFIEWFKLGWYWLRGWA